MREHTTAHEALVAKLVELTAVRVDRIGPETDVIYDLKLGGDDLEEVLGWIQDEHGVDFSGLDARTLPLNEPPQSLFTFWGRRAFESLTVGHLLSVMEAGRWARS